MSGQAVCQRVLNHLLRTRLYYDRMICLLDHPLPPSPVSKLSLFLSFPVWPRGRGGEVGEEPKHTTAIKPALYKSFNTLWAVGCGLHKGDRIAVCVFV
jgi:hypothetical protein